MARRDGRPDIAPSRYPFGTPQPKGKGPVVALLALLVVAGVLLQANWMQRAREKPASDLVAPGGFADKLGGWMML